MTIPFLNIIQGHWRGLQPRERMVLTGGGIALLVMLYFIILLPMQNELADLRKAVPKEKAQLALMRVQAKQVTRLRASGKPAVTSGNLLSRVEQSATVRGLRQNITRMEPDSDNGARVSLDSVSFDSLASWIDDLQKQAGVHVEKASFETQPEPGMVNARLTLRGSGT